MVTNSFHLTLAKQFVKNREREAHQRLGFLSCLLYTITEEIKSQKETEDLWQIRPITQLSEFQPLLTGGKREAEKKMLCV